MGQQMPSRRKLYIASMTRGTRENANEGQFHRGCPLSLSVVGKSRRDCATRRVCPRCGWIHWGPSLSSLLPPLPLDEVEMSLPESATPPRLLSLGTVKKPFPDCVTLSYLCSLLLDIVGPEPLESATSLSLDKVGLNLMILLPPVAVVVW